MVPALCCVTVLGVGTADVILKPMQSDLVGGK